MDRISNLPDGIITHILSFLPTEEAASTSVLSKRWRDKFAFSPNLHLTFDHPDKWNWVVPPQIFIDFVDRVLALSGNSAVRRFTLKCGRCVGSAHTNRWIRNVISRGTVSDLHLDISADDSVPFEVFSCKTLVSLKLKGGFEIHMPPTSEDASLPALKYFSIYLPRFDNLDVYGKLVSTCPALEEFIINPIEWPLHNWLRILSVPSLKRLTITSVCEMGDMSFDHPNLVYLHYSGFVQRQYPAINLDSLVEAKLEIETPYGDFDTWGSLSLIEGLKNVKILNLARPLTVEIFMNFSEAMPVFENLFHLTITTDAPSVEGAGISYLPSLLKKFPNLQTLVIKGLLCDDDEFCKCTSGCSCLVACGVKVLELTEYNGTINELDLMKRFLEKLLCLELVKIRVNTEDDREMLRVTKDLLMLPRASSKCKIQIESVET